MARHLLIGCMASLAFVIGCDKGDTQDASSNAPASDQAQVPSRALQPVDAPDASSAAEAPEPPRIVTWLSSDYDIGESSSTPKYECNPFIIGNPPNQTPIQYDKIEIQYLQDTPSQLEPTASLMYVTSDTGPGEDPGLHRITEYFYSGEAPVMRTKHNLEVNTIGPDSQEEMHFVDLNASSGTRIQVTFFLGDRKMLVSPVVALPDWNSLPSAAQLYSEGKETTPGQKGAQLTIPLAPP